MTKRAILESLARKITGDNTRKCSSVKAALHCIAEKANTQFSTVELPRNATKDIEL